MWLFIYWKDGKGKKVREGRRGEFEESAEVAEDTGSSLAAANQDRGRSPAG